MKLFIICTVRNATSEYRLLLEKYVLQKESEGCEVHLPHRDTDQIQSGINICRQNMAAIKAADEIHIFYNPDSQGTHFDMGVSFALNKKIVIVQNGNITEGKSFSRMLSEWERLGRIN